jgi:hypothetical protein
VDEAWDQFVMVCQQALGELVQRRLHRAVLHTAPSGARARGAVDAAGHGAA